MAINQSPPINLVIGGPPVVVTVECHQGPGGSQIDNASTIGLSANPAPTIATAAVTGARQVTVTPGASAGDFAMFVNETPGADKNLQLNIHNEAPPALREIVFVSQA